MRRGIGYASAWLAATTAAVVGAWLGCAIVLHSTSPSAPAVLSSAPTRQVGRLPTAATLAPSLIPSAGPAQRRSDTTATPVQSVSLTPNPAPQASPMLTAAPQTGLPDARPSQATPRVERTPGPVRPTSSPAPGDLAKQVTPFQQTFQTSGGTATVRFAPKRVEMLDVQPADGFWYCLEQVRPARLRLLFMAGRHQSELLAGWGEHPTLDIIEYWW